MSDVVMPRLSDSMEEGTILRWLKENGEPVAKGDEIVEIETDKANMTYEADTSGVLEILADEGLTLPVGRLIARIGDGAASEQGQRTQQAADSTAAPNAAAPSVREASPPAGRLNASPGARRLADELGLDIALVPGSGPGGRIVKADVARTRDASAGRAPAGTPARLSEGFGDKGMTTPIDLSPLQRTVARRMTETKSTVPEFSISTEVNMAGAVALRTKLGQLAADGRPPSINDMIVKAAALALREFPRVNGSYTNARFELYERVNIGVAVGDEEILILPTVFDADRKSLGEIAGEIRELAGRVRAGEITPRELSGGTFTVSNLGMFGATQFTAIINGGQAAILAVGALRDTPVVESGDVVAGTRMNLTLVCDHRIVYGVLAARFLDHVRRLLEAPSALTT